MFQLLVSPGDQQQLYWLCKIIRSMEEWYKYKDKFTFLNPLRAKFFRENINMYLHFVSFLHIDTTQVRQEPTNST